MTAAPWFSVKTAVGESFTNQGSIDVASTGDLTKMEIAGTVTINGFLGGGNINLGGSGAQSGDELVSDGKTATLTLIEQTLKGAGTIGDTNLTIDNTSGTIIADLTGETLSLGGSSTTPILTNGSGGTLEATGGGILSAVNAPIANSGTIAALNGGIVKLGPVLSTGAIDIGANSVISLLSEVIGSITFTGDGAKLIVNSSGNGGVDGEILGAVATDSIDVASTVTPYSTNNHLSWQQTSASGGVLSLINSSGQSIDALALAGAFTQANFTMTSDGSQGTLIEVGNPPPPAATTADMIMRTAPAATMKSTTSAATPSRRPMRSTQISDVVAGRRPRRLRGDRHDRHADARQRQRANSKSTTSATTTSPATYSIGQVGHGLGGLGFRRFFRRSPAKPTC